MAPRLMADRHYADGWAVRLVHEQRLPERYAESWPEELDELAGPSLHPGMSILDVGGGSSPTIPPDRRPHRTQYAGLDVSKSELRGAPSGSYDELFVADAGTRLSVLEERFDLVVSWQVLEHVGSLAAALENLRCYLRPGGRMILVLSGRFSIFALLNLLIPRKAAHRGMELLLRRPPETVFPARYNRCWARAMRPLLAAWSSSEIRPKYEGASYFVFSPLLMRAYLRYENWTLGRPDLATHYLIAAVR